MTNIALTVIAVVIGLIILGVVARTVKSLLRLVIGVIVGILAAALIYYGASTLGYADRIPNVAYIIIAVVCAVSVMLRGRR